MNKQILTLVEQVARHRLADEKKLELLYRLMRLYKYGFEMDDCSQFIPNEAGEQVPEEAYA